MLGFGPPGPWKGQRRGFKAASTWLPREWVQVGPHVYDDTLVLL